MGAIPGTVETDKQPPMTVPLRHFVVGLGFLLAGVLVGLGVVPGTIPGLGTLAHVHLLLAGWVCLTIMGAMTQFVPVWSGVELYSRRLASVQLDASIGHRHSSNRCVFVDAGTASNKMDRHRVGTSLYAGLLFTVLGVIAWVSGEPFIFPSLGPSAFILAFERRGNERGPTVWSAVTCSAVSQDCSRLRHRSGLSS